MRTILTILLTCAGSILSAQNNPHGLALIGSLTEYQKTVQLDSNNRLVEIKKYIPDIQLDIRYASKNNFTGQKVYTQARAFARLPVVKALRAVQSELKKNGLGLKIYDGYRPYDVTVKFFKLASDKNFVANPKDGSRHNRGCAIDLSLIDYRTGKELQMPTPYDSFAPEAAADFKNLSPIQIKNRDTLIKAMERHGFRVLDNEWWHYDFTGWKNYSLMNLRFEDL